MSDEIMRELSYTSYEQSCKNPAVTNTGSLRECRRQYGHTGVCASGFGRAYFEWEGTDDEL